MAKTRNAVTDDLNGLLWRRRSNRRPNSVERTTRRFGNGRKVVIHTLRFRARCPVTLATTGFSHVPLSFPPAVIDRNDRDAVPDIMNSIEQQGKCRRGQTAERPFAASLRLLAPIRAQDCPPC